MNDPNNIQNEAYVDQLFRLAVLRAAEKEGRASLALEEDSPIPTIQPSDTQKTVMKRKLRKDSLLHDAKSFFRGAWYVNQKVSAYLVLFVLVCAGTLGSADAVRSKFFDLFLKPHEEYSTVKLVVYDEEGNIIEGRTQNFFVDFPIPQYVPDGMHVKELVITEKSSFLDYGGLNEKTLLFTVRANNRIHLDTENVPEGESISINGNDGILVLKDGFISITWTTDDNLFMVRGDIDENELIKIAKSVE